MIDPSLDGVLVDSDFFDCEFSRPPVISYKTHRRKLPFFFTQLSKQKGSTDLIMTISKDIRCDLYFFPDNSFDGKVTTINFRLDMLNDHPVFSISIMVINRKNPFSFIFMIPFHTQHIKGMNCFFYFSALKNGKIINFLNELSKKKKRISRDIPVLCV